MSEENKLEVTGETTGETEDDTLTAEPPVSKDPPPQKTYTPEQREKLEDVAATIKDMRREAKPQEKRPTWLTVLMVIFFPITGLVMLFRWASRKIKLPITVKTTIIFTLMFGVVLIAYVLFIIFSIKGQLAGGVDPDEYVQNLTITSIILVTLFIIVGAVVGGFASQTMLKPIKKMTATIKSIDADNLSARIDETDSQDELKELSGHINEMLDEIEDAFGRQANFVSDASHELKTPLAVIQGYAGLLKRWGKDDPSVLGEGIDAISREADNMKRIVEQLLLLAKLGSFTMTKTRFDLTKEVAQITDGYTVTGIKQRIEFKGGGEIILETDKNLLMESVRTLVDNAVKYTPQDGGVILVECKSVGNHAEITVKDNGIGISEKDLPHVFERFYRCDKSRSRESGSAGLGLTIAKTIIEMIGGVITVESKLGEGTTFTIKLF